jgi:hypothetical protein
MLKYLSQISSKLEDIKRGIKNNNELWKHVPENCFFVESVIEEIEKKNSEIENLKKTLSEKYAEARRLSEEKKAILTRLEKRAIGIHADTPDKLNEYGINNK